MSPRRRETVASTVSVTDGGELPPGVRQKGNRFEGRFKVGGKRYSVTGATPEEAYEALLALRERVCGGAADLVTTTCWTVGRLVAEWMDAHPEWKPRTRHDYEELAQRWVLPYLGTTRVDELEPRRVERFLGSLPQRQAAKVFALLRAALRAGYRWGIVPEDITRRITAPRYVVPRKELPTPESMAQALASRRDDQWWTWIALAVSTGLRPGEQAALRWEDWIPERHLLVVRRSGQYIEGRWVETPPKTASGTRQLSLPKLAEDALDRQRERVSTCSELIFANPRGNPYSAWAINDGIKRFCRRAGLPPLTPHQLRHYHASLLLQQGIPLTLVSRRLGHASPEVTARIYAHWLGDDALAAQAVDTLLQI